MAPEPFQGRCASVCVVQQSLERRAIQEDAELGQHPRALVPLLFGEDGCPTRGNGPARLPVRRARPWVSRFAVRRYGERGPCPSEARATSQPRRRSTSWAQPAT